jgi:hypothetical protein
MIANSVHFLCLHISRNHHVMFSALNATLDIMILTTPCFPYLTPDVMGAYHRNHHVMFSAPNATLDIMISTTPSFPFLTPDVM